MKKFFILMAIMSLMLTVGLTQANAQLLSVDTELILAIDASGSVSPSEYDLMMQGYINAFNPATNPDIVSIIQSGSSGAIAVSLFLFSEGQAQLTDGDQTWWYINDSASALAFSNAIGGMVRPSPGDPFYLDTYISSAINYAYPMFDTNIYDGSQQVIDVSGEGTDDTGEAALQSSVLAALGAGIDKINGIVIETDSYPAGYLESYFNDYVKGGTDAFVNVADGYDDFSAAIQEKIEQEIPPPVPEPMSLFLFGTGFAGLVGLRRKK